METFGFPQRQAFLSGHGSRRAWSPSGCHRMLLLAVAFLFSGMASGGEVPALHWEQLPGDGLKTLRLIGLGPKGAIEVFRREPLTILRVGADGGLQKVRELEPHPAFRYVHTGALGRETGQWLFLAKEGRLQELFLLETDGRIRTLPSPEYFILRLGWIGRDPVAVVLPFPRAADSPAAPVIFRQAEGSPEAPEFPREKDPPLLLRYDGKIWKPLLLQAMEKGETPETTEIDFRRQVLLASGSEGRLWVVNQNLYRIRLLSPAGRVSLDFSLEGVHRRKSAEEAAKEDEKFRQQLIQAGWKIPEGATVRARDYEPVIAGVTEGPDGRLYLLTAPGVFGEGNSLDRLNPETLELERLMPPGIEAGSYASIVGAVDGLYFGNHLRISWDALEAAPWKPVKTFEVSSLEEPKP